MSDALIVALITLGGAIVLLLAWLIAFPLMDASARKAKAQSDAAWLAKVDEWNRPAHEHGAWCHPSADGCPDRPGT